TCLAESTEMNRACVIGLGVCLTVIPWTGAYKAARAEQAPGAPVVQPNAAEAPANGALAPAPEPKAVVALSDGPVHAAVISPPKNQQPVRIDQSPPVPIVERPAVDAPSPNAVWIAGYWDWDTTRKDFVWVTGTWRVPPPGRFWVNTYWKRDDQGWYRVPGFWS